MDDEDFLSEAKILKLCGKSNVQDIVKINAFALGIKSVCNLAIFANLQIVTISLNELNDLSPFSNCLSLKELYIRKNKILQLTQVLVVVFLNVCAVSLNHALFI